MREQDFTTNALRYVGSEIERMAESLDLDEPVTKQALRLYAQAKEDDVTTNRLDDMSAACLYGAIRTHPGRSGGTFKDVAAVARIQDKRILTVSTRVFNELELPVPPPDPETTLETACEKLDIEDESDVLVELLNTFDTDMSDRAPTTIAGSVIFAGTYLEGCSYELTQDEVAEAIGTTAESIRKQYAAVLREAYYSGEFSFVAHRFGSETHGLDVLQTELKLPDTVIDEAETLLDAHPEVVSGLGSREGIVCAAVFSAARSTDDDELTIADLASVADVSCDTITKYTEEFR